MHVFNYVFTHAQEDEAKQPAAVVGEMQAESVIMPGTGNAIEMKMMKTQPDPRSSPRGFCLVLNRVLFCF